MTSTACSQIIAIFGQFLATLHTSHLSRNATSNLSQHQHYFHQVAVPEIQVSVPVTFQLLPSTAGALDITCFFRKGMSPMSPILRWLEVWTMCPRCVRRSLEELCWNLLITLNCRSESLLLYYITCWYLFHLWLALFGSKIYRYDGATAMATALLPQSVMNICSHANAMPDLWRTSLVKDGISLAEHATLAWKSWNLQPRLPAKPTLKSTFEPGNATKTERQSPVELRFVVPPDPGRPEFLQFPSNCCCSGFHWAQLLAARIWEMSQMCSLPAALRWQCPWSTCSQRQCLGLGRV